MQRLTDWEQYNFQDSIAQHELTVIFPSRELYMLPALTRKLHLNPSALPKTLDQWYELCHPSDHMQITRLELFLKSNETAITLTRKLYCGDGVYRPFRLEVQLIRDKNNNPVKLLGREIPSLTAWLENAEEGDIIECASASGSVRILEAVSFDGVKVLQDVSRIDDMSREIHALRRELQRHIFGMTDYVYQPEYTEKDILLRDSLEEILRLSMNVLTGRPRLKAIKRSLSEETLTAGICGLTGSGKTSLANALIGETLIPSQNPAGIPVICKEGAERGAKIIFQDGRTETADDHSLTLSYMRDMLKRSGISRIQLTIPGAFIPRGVSVIDTAGFDRISTGTQKNILPELDVILYVIPIRCSLKKSDYDYLKELYAVNEHVIILLTCADLESDDKEAGKSVRTIADKLAHNIESLRRDIKSVTENYVQVIPVSSRLGLSHFFSRKSHEWQSSNLESVINSFTHTEITPLTQALILRTERTLRIIEGALADKKLTGSSRWRLQDYSATLRKTLAEYERFVHEKAKPVEIHTMPANQESGRNLLSSLVMSLREHDFRTRFYGCKVFKSERRIVLLGADKQQNIKLYSRLAHNIMCEYLPDGGITESEWLYSGYSAPFECVMLPALSPGENILIAPADRFLKKESGWQEIFSTFTPAVSVDLMRFSSGMNDLLQSPYFASLALNDWVLTYSNGGLLTPESLTLIPERVKEFCEGCGLRVPEIFIFENYRIY